MGIHLSSRAEGATVWLADAPGVSIADSPPRIDQTRQVSHLPFGACPMVSQS